MEDAVDSHSAICRVKLNTTVYGTSAFDGIEGPSVGVLIESIAFHDGMWLPYFL